MRLETYRQEIFEDAQASIDRITSEKELWESKYSHKRRALKEVEQTLTKKLTDLENANIQLQAQVNRLQSEQDNKESDYLHETQNLKQQLANLDNTAGQAFFIGSAQAEDMMRLKA